MKRTLALLLTAALLAAVPLAVSPAEDEPLTLFDNAYVRTADGLGAALMLEPSDESYAVAVPYDGAAVTVAPWVYPEAAPGYLCVSLGTNVDGDFATGYIREADLAREPGAALPVGHVSRSVTLESEAGAISLGEVFAGAEVTLSGRSNTRYFVAVGERSGALAIEDVSLSAEAASYVSARLHGFPGDGVAIRTACTVSEAHRSDCEAKYGVAEYDWPVEARAEQARRGYLAGEGHTEFPVVPLAAELTEADARDIAWAVFTGACGYTEVSRDAYLLRCELAQRLVDGSRRWYVRISSQSDKLNLFVVALDSVSGELLNQTDVSAFLDNADTARVPESDGDEARAMLEADYGVAYPYWTPAQKLDFMRRYSPVEAESYTLPDESDLPQDDALALAKAELRRRYDETVESLAALSYTVDFFRALYPSDTDDGDAYQFEFYTADGAFRYTVRIRAGDGEIVALGDYVNGNG